MKLIFGSLLFLLALFAPPLATTASAQVWPPSKPVRLIVPIQGGTVDVLDPQCQGQLTRPLKPSTETMQA